MRLTLHELPVTKANMNMRNMRRNMMTVWIPLGVLSTIAVVAWILMWSHRAEIEDPEIARPIIFPTVSPAEKIQRAKELEAAHQELIRLQARDRARDEARRRAAPK
jgi:hypothetical protein